MDRVATLGQHSFIMGNILDSQSRLFDAQAQISTGKKTQIHTDIARDTTRLLDFETNLGRADQFIANNNRVSARVERMDSALSGMFDALSELRQLMIQNQNSATGTAGELATEAGHLLDTVVGLLNSREDGRFLFSGSLTNVAPVQTPVPNPAAFGVADSSYYQGDSVRLSVRVDLNFTVTYGIEGNRQGFQEMIGAMQAAIEGDNTGNSGLIDSAIDLANGALDKIANYRNEAGSTLKVLEEVTSRHKDFKVFLENQISEIENIDVTEAVARLTADQTVLQASFLTLSQISRLTLVDFLS